MIADNRIDFFRCYAIDSMRYMWNVVRFMHNIRLRYLPRGSLEGCHLLAARYAMTPFLPLSLLLNLAVSLSIFGFLVFAALLYLHASLASYHVPRATCKLSQRWQRRDATTGSPENTLKAIKWAIFTINGKIKYRFFLHFVSVWRFAQFRTCFDFFGFVFVSLFCFCFCFVFSSLIRCQPRSSSLHSSWPRAIATCLSLSLSVMESKLVAVVGWP